MSTETTVVQGLPGGELAEFQALHSRAHKETDVRRAAIVASKGTLDMAYPVLILASTAAAMGMEAGVFFTFYGLDIIQKKKFRHLKVAPLANPAAPIPVPNLLGAIPGATFLATRVMKFLMARQKMPPVEELLKTCQELGVRFFACSTTMGVMGVKPADLIEGADIAGAAAFLEFASQAQVTLFI
ncbi:MAG: DsrE/DsrF/DrsH-like family protein [Chloroflexi bacterium]|nr:DsrE/DsrF/DrsH-like family protein [Chloroflexota bacterium]